MKILITGNMGYIGPEVVKHLRSLGNNTTIIGFDTAYFGSSISNQSFLPERRLDLQYFGDVREFPKDILKNLDAVVHLAAISNDPIGNAFEKATEDINYRSTIDLAENAKASGVKNFIFFSSCSIYGAAEDAARDENSKMNPLTAYARSKIRSETELEKLASENFCVTSLRFSTACGWSERMRLDLVLNDFVACAITTKNITVLSDGSPWRPLINVKDMARAVEWAMMRTCDAGGPFLAVNVGSDEWNYQVRDLAQAVARVVPGVTVSINKNAQPDKRSYRVNFNLFKTLAPDHQPVVDLDQSIKELQEGLISIAFNDPDFRASRYMRLVHLTDLRKKGYLDDDLKWN